MATKPIPANTHNVTVNMPTGDAINLIRSAGRMGFSMGAYCRRCFRLAKFVWAAARCAAKAEEADLGAIEIMERVLADSSVKQEEVPALLRALELVKRSATLDCVARTTITNAATEEGQS